MDYFRMQVPGLVVGGLLALLLGCEAGPADCSTEGLPAHTPDVKRYESLVAQVGQADSHAAGQALVQLFGNERFFFADWVFEADSLAYATRFGSLQAADSLLALEFRALHRLPSTARLLDSVQAYFPPDFPFAAELEGPFRRFKQFFPAKPIPAFRTNVMGPVRDMPWDQQYIRYRVRHDTLRNLVAVSLDYFCHPLFPTLPPEMPRYARAHCRPEALAPAVMQMLVGNLARPVAVADHPTLLDYLVSFGIRNYIVAQLLPCTPDSLLLAYTQPNYAWAEAHEAEVYARMLPLLYEQNILKFDEFLNTGPSTRSFGPESPSRLAEFMGLQLVRAYVANNPGVRPAQLLAMNRRLVFEGAKYKP